MAKSNAELMEKLTNSPTPTAQGGVANQVHAYLDRMKGQLALALPKHLTPDRLARVSLTSIRTTPLLLQCSIESLCACVMEAAQLGLEPGVLGECYLIPYGKEAKLIKGYRGLLKLVRQTGELSTISAEVIHENDVFIYEKGFDEKLVHKPNFKNPGEMIGAYAYSILKDGGRNSTVMSKLEIDKIRARSRAKDSGPWVTDYEEMAKKTALKRLTKHLPMSIEAREAIEKDDQVEFGAEPVELNLGDVQRIEVKPPEGKKKGKKESDSSEALLAHVLTSGDGANRVVGELSPAQAKYILSEHEAGTTVLNPEDAAKLLEYVRRFPDA